MRMRIRSCFFPATPNSLHTQRVNTGDTPCANCFAQGGKLRIVDGAAAFVNKSTRSFRDFRGPHPTASNERSGNECRPVTPPQAPVIWGNCHESADGFCSFSVSLLPPNDARKAP